MLTIDKSKPLTIYDFIKNKSFVPFSKWRNTSKFINFSLLFGASAPRFAVLLEQSGLLKKNVKSLFNYKILQEHTMLPLLMQVRNHLQNK